MDQPASASVCETVIWTIEPKTKDLGGFSVRRVIPDDKQAHVGPYVFFDHLGPADFPPGEGIHVRSHPHIGLATVTYLFEGELFHKDSLGVTKAIQPGAVNLMVAGKGVVHAETTRPQVKASGQRLHALQLWMALPDHKVEAEPSFNHYPAADIPKVQLGKSSTARVLMGEGFGCSSPVMTLSPTTYLDLHVQPGDSIRCPEAQERALYIIDGSLAVGGQSFGQHTMVGLKQGADVDITALSGPAHVALIGGEHVGERLLEWNFVAKDAERLQQAKQDWLEGRFPNVSGETDFIPLPDHLR